MKAAVFYGKEDIRFEEVPVKQPEDHEVLIRVKACGICGTDMHIYSGAEGAAKTTPPTILGHEFCGVVEAVGAAVKSVKPGDRVSVDPNDMCGECYFCRNGKAHFCENMIGIGTTVNGGFAEYCTVREKQVYKLGDTIPFREAAMAEPVACCLHGMDLAGVKTGDTVMIIGGGTIGLIMLQLAKISGAANLILVEPVEWKRELGLKLGATAAINPATEDIGKRLAELGLEQVDVAIECVGMRSTMMDAIRYTGRGGTAMLFGLTGVDDEIPLKPFDIFKREVTVKASFINPYTQKRAISLLESGSINVADLISDEIDLSEFGELMKNKGYRGKGKIIVTCS